MKKQILAFMFLSVSLSAQIISGPNSFFKSVEQIQSGPVLSRLNIEDPYAAQFIPSVRFLLTQGTTFQYTGSTDIDIEYQSSLGGRWFAGLYNPVTGWSQPAPLGESTFCFPNLSSPGAACVVKPTTVSNGYHTFDIGGSSYNQDPVDPRKANILYKLEGTAAAPRGGVFAFGYSYDAGFSLTRLSPPCPNPTVTYIMGCPEPVRTLTSEKAGSFVARSASVAPRYMYSMPAYGIFVSLSGEYDSAIADTLASIPAPPKE